MKKLARDVFLTTRAYEVTLTDTHVQVTPSSEMPAEPLYLSPGWIDIQVNGFAGYDVNRHDVQSRDIAEMVRRLWREGVTGVLPTVITQSSNHIERCLRAVAEACDSFEDVRASILGVHLEGPYISPLEGARGAHLKEHVRPPDWTEFTRWQEAAGGRIRIVTLAPEQPGSSTFIHNLVRTGVKVSIGHTAASTEAIAAAVEAGASLSTHLGNGAPAMVPRHPNFIWDQLAEDRLDASFIFDGHHLPASVMRVFLRAKGIDKSILVSDAVAVAGMPPGLYDTVVGGKVELHSNGRLSLYGTPYLAGSASCLKDGIEHAVRLAGCSLPQAVQMASVNPARALGLMKRDDHTLFRWDERTRALQVVATVVAGQVVYGSA